MIHFAVETAMTAGANDIVVVVGHGREKVSAYLHGAFGSVVRTVVQEMQRGTGHAVLTALPAIPREASRVLVLYGDTPLLEAPALRRLIAAHAATEPAPSLSMLTMRVADPTGYGRIERSPTGEGARRRGAHRRDAGAASVQRG